nr:hypothetical protein [Candidatus Sigynarchaeota archaeon]
MKVIQNIDDKIKKSSKKAFRIYRFIFLCRHSGQAINSLFDAPRGNPIQRGKLVVHRSQMGLPQ